MAEQKTEGGSFRSEQEPWWPFDIGEWLRLAESWRNFPRGPWSLRVEEYEEDGRLVVLVEAPGIDPERDVDLRVVDGTLHITVERQEDPQRSARAGYRSELRYGRFTRELPLPPRAKSDGVAATYKDGMLRITVPIGPESEEGVRVLVQRG
jgi:HSP20 family protein